MYQHYNFGDDSVSLNLPLLASNRVQQPLFSSATNHVDLRYGIAHKEIPSISLSKALPNLPHEATNSDRNLRSETIPTLPRYSVGIVDWLSIGLLLVINLGFIILLTLQAQNNYLIVGVNKLSPIAARQLATICIVLVGGTAFNLLLGLMMGVYARLTTAQGSVSSLRVFRRITEPGLNFIGLTLSLFEGQWKAGAWLISYALLQITHVLLVSGVVPEALTIIGSQVNTNCADYRQIGGTLAERALPQTVINSLSASLTYNISLHNVTVPPASPIPINSWYIAPTLAYGLDVSCRQEPSLAVDTANSSYHFSGMNSALSLGLRENVAGISIIPVDKGNYTFVDSTGESRIAILYSTGAYLSADAITQTNSNDSSLVSGWGLVSCAVKARVCRLRYGKFDGASQTVLSTTTCTSQAQTIELALLIDWLQKLDSSPGSGTVYLGGSRLSFTIFGTVNGTLSLPVAHIGSPSQIAESLSTFYSIALSTGNQIAREASSVGEAGLLSTCIFHEPRLVIVLALGNYLIGLGVGASLTCILIWWTITSTYDGRHAPLSNSFLSAGAGLGPKLKGKLENIRYWNKESRENELGLIKLGYVSITSGTTVRLVLDEIETATRAYSVEHSAN
ncbi:hypothetical protein T439DRAFT_347576 [Meredithblackwellia eburnea MCA 4105]